MYRNTFVEINLNNIKNNVQNIINNYQYKYYIGVVKGNCYGHGYGIIKTLLEAGINYLAVASLEEALNVREQTKDTPILCLQPIHKEDLEICSQKNISICINDREYFNDIKDLKFKLNVHLKIDSGMNRLGLKDKKDVDYIYKEINKSKSICLEGIFSHFRTSGISDREYLKQIDKFKHLTSSIDLTKIPLVHFERSMTLVAHPKLDFCNGVRLGLIMYGFNYMPKKGHGLLNNLRTIKQKINLKIKDIKLSDYKELDLKQAFSLYSEVIQVKHVMKDEYVGYGLVYQTKEDMDIAVVDAGYADGINRNRRNSYVMINNKKFPIVGDICMGMFMVKVDKSVKKYDKVAIINEQLDINKIARHMKTSAYEVLCMIDSSVPRIYKK